MHQTKNSKNAVFSFYNTPSGLYKWWDEFPKEITEKLALANIDHLCFYRDYTEHSIYKPSNQREIKENSWSWLFSIYKNAKQYDNVIFHTHSFYPPLKLFLLTLINKNFQWIITEHRLGSSPTSSWKKHLRGFLRKCRLGPKYVICVSDAVEKRNQQLYGTHTKRIHNGINFISACSQKPTASPKRVLYVGRLDPKKGIWNLVYAFKIISETTKNTDLKLTIVGGGGLLKELQEYVKKNQLEEHINFAGYQPDPSPFYTQADFLVIPTIIKEAFSLVALEARSFNLPILYVNRGGLPEAVGDAGVPLQGTTPELIATSLLSFKEEKNNYNKMIQACAKDLEYFSMHRMTNEYVEFYHSLFD